MAGFARRGTQVNACWKGGQVGRGGHLALSRVQNLFNGAWGRKAHLSPPAHLIKIGPSQVRVLWVQAQGLELPGGPRVNLESPIHARLRAAHAGRWAVLPNGPCPAARAHPPFTKLPTCRAEARGRFRSPEPKRFWAVSMAPAEDSHSHTNSLPLHRPFGEDSRYYS